MSAFTYLLWRRGLIKNNKHTLNCMAMPNKSSCRMHLPILSSQVVSLPFQSVMEVANFCAAMDTLIDQDGIYQADSPLNVWPDV